MDYLKLQAQNHRYVKDYLTLQNDTYLSKKKKDEKKIKFYKSINKIMKCKNYSNIFYSSGICHSKQYPEIFSKENNENTHAKCKQTLFDNVLPLAYSKFPVL